MAIGTMIGIGAGLSAATGIGSSLLNKKSVSDTNQTNMQIAQMNNEWSEKMMEKQMQYNSAMNDKQFGQAKELQQIQNDFQTEMWNKTNEYNSPAAQRERLQQAGLNPYMMLSGGSAGTATAMNGSSASAPSAGSVGLPSPSQVQAIPAQYDFSSVGSSVVAGLDLYQKSQLMKSEQANVDASTDQLRIENKYRGMKLVAEIAEKMANSKNTEVRSAYQQILNEYAEQGIKTDLDIKNQTLANMKETFRGLVLENAMTSEQLRVFPEQVRMQLGVSASQILLNKANSRLSEQKMVESVFNQWKSDAERIGIQQNNRILRQAAKDIVEKYYYEKEQIRLNRYPNGAQGMWNIIGNGFSQAGIWFDGLFK